MVTQSGCKAAKESRMEVYFSTKTLPFKVQEKQQENLDRILKNVKYTDITPNMVSEDQLC